MASLKERIERLRAKRDPSYEGAMRSPYGKSSAELREELEEGERSIAKRALELRAARERGEELSDPFHQATGAEVQAHIISYTSEGSFEDVPPELFVEFDSRVGRGMSEEHRQMFVEHAALGLQRSLAHFEEYERTA
jgi:hypothetical protein